MMHGISPQEWEEYLENRLPEEQSERIEAHLLSCLACWEHYQQLKLTTEHLHEAGTQLRHSLPLSDPQLYRALRGVFARIHAGRAVTSDQARSPLQARLAYLESVMAALCGPHTAASALRAAAKGSPARSLEQVTKENWEPFLANLTSIATVMCGDTGAHLVRKGGQL
jgi:hypothetical protein